MSHETFTRFARLAVERASRGRLTVQQARNEIRPLLHEADVTRIPAEMFARLMESDEPEPAPALQWAAEQYRARRSGDDE